MGHGVAALVDHFRRRIDRRIRQQAAKGEAVEERMETGHRAGWLSPVELTPRRSAHRKHCSGRRVS
ncbi:MAG: hypothetical protein KDA85_09055, partial [Planctomycetaceae bacterium]|nr:hypothetical protein [Planctomycetaceae bacterium]